MRWGHFLWKDKKFLFRRWSFSLKIYSIIPNLRCCNLGHSARTSNLQATSFKPFVSTFKVRYLNQYFVRLASVLWWSTHTQYFWSDLCLYNFFHYSSPSIVDVSISTVTNIHILHLRYSFILIIKDNTQRKELEFRPGCFWDVVATLRKESTITYLHILLT